MFLYITGSFGFGEILYSAGPLEELNILYVQYIFYIIFYCNFSMKNTPYKIACTNSLPEDEHMMFETCRRHKEFK